MKYLITGAAGFIGSSMAVKLCRSGHTVVGIDNFSDYYSPDYKKIRASKLFGDLDLEIVTLDISDRSKIKAIFDKHDFDCVIHLAAQAGVRIKLEENQKYTHSNLTGFANVLTETVINSVSTFIYASSSSVYGDFSQIPYSEKEIHLLPSSFYGATKLCNEIITPSLIRNSNTSARGVRFFSVYGPWGRPDMAYFRMAASAVSNTPFTLFGNGLIARDFTYIDDVVVNSLSLINELETRPSGYSDVVNIGGGRPITMEETISKIMQISGNKFNYEVSESNNNDVALTVADNTYLQSLVGEFEFTEFTDGMTKTINWATSEGVIENLGVWINSVK